MLTISSSNSTCEPMPCHSRAGGNPELPKGGQVLDLELAPNNGINSLKVYSRYKIQALTPGFIILIATWYQANLTYTPR